tara:strand:- start:1534 stop:1797 length:264 start_codon:yes stop_codon:yes gene_type:complete
MDEELKFGELSACDLQAGDIVEWVTWNSEGNDWESNYGIILDIKNEIKSNRLISVSKVIPLSGPKIEMEFFTMSLKLISRSEDNDLT